ncbi:unnamed protein product [Coregonus sp. 'balchen']|nr:unnamed protein product [Coregonus sp. 'balchen']
MGMVLTTINISLSPSGDGMVLTTINISLSPSGDGYGADHHQQLFKSIWKVSFIITIRVPVLPVGPYDHTWTVNAKPLAERFYHCFSIQCSCILWPVLSIKHLQLLYELAVGTRSGELISAPSIPGTVLINIADLIQRWTSDVFLSVVHRVLLPPAGDWSTRQSLAFFVQPDDEVLITCCDGSNKYPPVKAGKGYPLTEQALSGKVLQVSAMACYQLAPQYILLGLAEHVFLTHLLLLYCSVISFHLTPSHIRGISLHFLPLSYRGGCFLRALIIQLVYLLSGGNLYPNTLHEGNLEHFFFFLAMLMTINTLVFWWISSRIDRRPHGGGRVLTDQQEWAVVEMRFGIDSPRTVIRAYRQYRDTDGNDKGDFPDGLKEMLMEVSTIPISRWT